MPVNDQADLVARIEHLESKLKELKPDTANSKEPKEKKSKESKPRKASAYNLHMGKYLSAKKKELGELYNHKQAFAEGAKEWKEKKS